MNIFIKLWLYNVGYKISYNEDLKILRNAMFLEVTMFTRIRKLLSQEPPTRSLTTTTDECVKTSVRL